MGQELALRSGGCGDSRQADTLEKTDTVLFSFIYLLFNLPFWSVICKRKDTMKSSVSVEIFGSTSRS